MTAYPPSAYSDGAVRPVRLGTASGPSALLFLPHVAAMMSGAVVLLVPSPELGMQILAVSSCFYALFVYMSRGGRYLTPSGVFFLASGVFIGLAAYYLLESGSVYAPQDLRDLAGVAFISTVATGIVLTAISLRWRLSWPTRRLGQVSAPSRLQGRRFQLQGALLVLASQVPLIRTQLGPLAAAGGLAGVLMLVLAASMRRVNLRSHGDLLVIALSVVVPLGWVRLEFEGGGRLTLAGLGVAVLLVWNLARPHRLQKLVVLLSIPVFLFISKIVGLERSDTVNVNGERPSGAGLESLYNPLETFVGLVRLDPDEYTRLEPGPWFGRTFVNTAILPVPRSLWAGKPAGFGADLTQLLLADELHLGRVSSTHSMAALMHGEWYVNFGFLGLVMMPFVAGWFLALLDRSHLRLARSGLALPSDWWRATILACLTSSLGDLFWVGSFTYFSRGGLAAVVAWFLWKMRTRPARAAVSDGRNQADRVEPAVTITA